MIILHLKGISNIFKRSETLKTFYETYKPDPLHKKIRTVYTVRFPTGNNLSSRAASSQVLSTRESLTTVFGMGTGGSSQPSSPDSKAAPSKLNRRNY